VFSDFNRVAIFVCASTQNFVEGFKGLALDKSDRIQWPSTIQSEYQLAKDFIPWNIVGVNGLFVVGPQRWTALVAKPESKFPQGVLVGAVEAGEAHSFSVFVQHQLQVHFLRREPRMWLGYGIPYWEIRRISKVTGVHLIRGPLRLFPNDSSQVLLQFLERFRPYLQLVLNPHKLSLYFLHLPIAIFDLLIK